MKIEIDHKNKIISIWCSTDECPDNKIPNNLPLQVTELMKKKYYLGVFVSGQQSLKSATSNLIMKNLKQLAESNTTTF